MRSLLFLPFPSRNLRFSSAIDVIRKRHAFVLVQEVGQTIRMSSRRENSLTSSSPINTDSDDFSDGASPVTCGPMTALPDNDGDVISNLEHLTTQLHNSRRSFETEVV